MPKFDLWLLYVTVAGVGVTTLVRMGVSFGHFSFSSIATVVAVTTSLLCFKTWSALRNNRNRYLARHQELLSYQNISNNRGVIALLIDRAIDEELKEQFLAYHFLQQRPRNRSGLAAEVEDYLHDTFRIRIQFDVDDALAKLEDLGLLIRLHDNRFQAVPLEQACALVRRAHEARHMALTEDL